ncbi:MAG: hypothetical protein VXZ72_01620 [Chlamydiota bacterium]|nr:hypothetical protein [Chlamydiota bacterium]
MSQQDKGFNQPEDKKDFFLLLEGGMLAIKQQDEERAKALFDACESLHAEHHLVDIGRGYLHFQMLEVNQAITCFEKALEKEPNDPIANVLIGMASAFTKDNVEEGERRLRSALSNQEIPDDVQGLAHSSLDFINQFVKPSPGPAGQ